MTILFLKNDPITEKENIFINININDILNEITILIFHDMLVLFFKIQNTSTQSKIVTDGLTKYINLFFISF